MLNKAMLLCAFAKISCLKLISIYLQYNEHGKLYRTILRKADRRSLCGVAIRKDDDLEHTGS